MAKSATITLTTAGADTGPFNLLSNVDSFVTPFETDIPKASLVGGYTSNVVPDAATIIRVQSTGSCTNYIDLNYPTTTTTTTTTTTSTTTTTTTSGSSPQLFVYGKYINGSGDLVYTKNAGPQVLFANVASTNCDYLGMITGITAGDVITFSEDQGKVIAAEEGFNAGCPTTGFGCSYPITIVNGPNYIYITVDGSTNC